MTGKIGVGIIGTGFARRTQIPAFKNMDSVEVVSVASGSRTNAENTAKEFGISHWTDDWKETVSHEKVDLVCITTPPDLHRAMTIFALNERKHILCEKPFAMNVPEAIEMVRLAEENKDILTLVDHELRFTNGRMKVYEMIRSGKIGKIRHVKYNFNNGLRGDKDLPWSWWSDEKQGGGALGAIGSHVVDSLRWFLGAEIDKVFCRLNTHILTRPVGDDGEMKKVTTDDETLMILDFKESELVTNEATGLVSVSMVEAGEYRNAVEIFGTKGAIRVEDGGEISFADIKVNEWNSIDVDLGPVAPGMAVNGWSRGFVKIAEKIVEAITRGDSDIEHVATFRDGLAVQKVLDAAIRSHNSGKAISVED